MKHLSTLKFMVLLLWHESKFSTITAKPKTEEKNKTQPPVWPKGGSSSSSPLALAKFWRRKRKEKPVQDTIAKTQRQQQNIILKKKPERGVAPNVLSNVRFSQVD